MRKYGIYLELDTPISFLNTEGSCLMRLLVLEKIRMSQISPKNCTNEIKKPKIALAIKFAVMKSALGENSLY